MLLAMEERRGVGEEKEVAADLESAVLFPRKRAVPVPTDSTLTRGKRRGKGMVR